MTEQTNLIENAITIAAQSGARDDRHESGNNTDSADANPNAPVPTWRDTLPDSLKNTPSLAKFKDVESLAKSYLEGEKTFSSRVAIPKEDAPDADWEAFYRKTGRPEDKRYVPDGERAAEEEPLLAAYEEMLYDSGLSKRQGQRVFARMRDLSAKMEEEAGLAREAARQENLQTLEQAFGGEMDLRVNQIKAALGKFGHGELAALVEQTNYHPGLVQFLSKVGEAMASDRLVTGDAPPPSPASREAALAEIKRLENDGDFQVKYWSNDFEERQAAVKRIDGLYKVAYGG